MHTGTSIFNSRSQNHNQNQNHNHNHNQSQSRNQSQNRSQNRSRNQNRSQSHNQHHTRMQNQSRVPSQVQSWMELTIWKTSQTNFQVLMQAVITLRRFPLLHHQQVDQYLRQLPRKLIKSYLLATSHQSRKESIAGSRNNT